MDSEINIADKIEVIKKRLPKEYEVIEYLVDILERYNSEEE
ncbi:hypothetical protein [Romboutsia faecis]|nr:hypothetical protein [Romboutsia faecis]